MRQRCPVLSGSRASPEAEEAMNRRLDRTARNEALIRVVNERIEQVDKAAQEANYDHKENACTTS